MTKTKLVLFALILGGLLALMPAPAAAQYSYQGWWISPDHCTVTVLYWSYDIVIPGHYGCGLGEGPFTFSCYYKGPGVGCSNLGGETGPDCGDQAGCPIILGNGDIKVVETDLKPLRGRGVSLSLTRTWNSIWPPSQSAYAPSGIFGANWRSDYDEHVFYGGDGHGRVRQLFDGDSGAVTDTYDYDAFGNLINSTGSTPDQACEG